jgi:hypothetical protein
MMPAHITIRGFARAKALRRPLTVLSILVLLGVAALAVATMFRPEGGRPTASSPEWVGVQDGDSIPGYIQLSQSRLAALAASEPGRASYALVSLDRYLRPDEVATLLGAVAGMSSVTAYARLPLPGHQTERVTLAAAQLPDDLTAAMTRVADRKDGDADSFGELADQQPPGTLREIYASNAAVSRTEASAYRQQCACVFALVVRASATVLVNFSARPDVRAVDPAPDLTDVTAAVFAAPLPEQVDRATPPGS